MHPAVVERQRGFLPSFFGRLMPVPSELRKAAPERSRVAWSDRSAAAFTRSEYPDLDDPTEQIHAFETVPAVYLCATLNAQAVGRSRLVVTDADGEEVEGGSWDALRELLSFEEQPVSFREVLVYTEMCLQVQGNAFWELVRRNERAPVAEMWPLNPARVHVLPGPQGQPRGYVYRVDGRSKTLEPWRVWHVLDLGFGDWRGLSRLAVLAGTVAADQKLARAHNSLLDNGVILSGIMSVESDVSQDDVEEAARIFAEKHAGAPNIGKIAWIRGGRKFEPIQLSPLQLQALETRHWYLNEILDMFRVPGLVYGSPGRDQSATRENATTQKWLHEEAVVDWSDALSAAMTEVLVPMLGVPGVDGARVRLDRRHLPIYAEKRREEALADAALLDRGVKTIDEVRESLSLGPLPDGLGYVAPRLMLAERLLKAGAMTPNEIADAFGGALGVSRLDAPGLDNRYLDGKPLSKSEGGDDLRWKTVNEKRDEAGYDPLPGGDAVFKPASMIPAIEVEE